MVTTIKLPVIKHTKSKITTLYTYGLFVIPLCYLILIFFWDDNNNQLGKAFLLIYILFLTLGFLKKKPRKKNGFLIINKDNIIHSQQDNVVVTRFSLVLLEDITFIYMGYAGRANTLSLLMDPGDENELQFKYKGQKFSYNIYLEHKHLPLLRKVFKECETVGKKVTIKNTHGARTKL